VQSPRVQKILILVASVTVTCVFFINLCALVFRCGCHSLWAGGNLTCNIHFTGIHHCPWCQHDWLGPFAAMIIPQIWLSFAPAPWSWSKRLALALAAFPVFGGIAALVYGVASGYW
jgi:hypothetical protein